MMENPIKVFIHRRVDDMPELIAEFRFSDLAVIAAIAICQQYHWDVSVENVQNNGDFSKRFCWGTKTAEAVVEKELP